MFDTYESIRTENIKGYGTKITNYGPVLLANLYNDKTHFIYELLQNAEDACERAKKAGKKDKFVVYFYLFKDRLEVRHNGILFDEGDVQGICRIAEGTKKEDLSQIGKFGIGFKSVYAFTKSPEVYSGDWSFTIKDYVHPHPLQKRDDVDSGDTLFVIPFNHDEISKEVSFSMIKMRLKNLDFRNLLFLSNVREIKWEVMGEVGDYSRESSSVIEYVRKVELFKASEKKEEWLVFERPIAINGRDTKVEIAFKVLENQIVPFNGAKLASYFLTDKDTYLKFLIQGQYKTTPARDNIHLDDETNKRLLEETATLVSESISKIKEMNLLNVSFLNTLPIESKDISDENMIFHYMYNSVKEKLLSGEALLPAYGSEYVSSEKALIVRAKELLELLSSEQLDSLFKKNGTKWLDENITENKTPLLREYLMKELGIAEVDPEKFAREFTEDFIKEQHDDWVKKFYVFLFNREELWKEGYRWSSEGVLRSKPIIRLQDSRHTKPFDSSGNALVYLPGIDETRFSTVKKNLVMDEKAMKFLYKLGLREPDVVDDITNNILPKYGKVETTIVDAEENKQDVKYIFETLRACPIQESKERLLNKLRETPFLMAVNLGDSRRVYKKPRELYLGEVFTKTNDLKLYFEGNGDIWFLDERDAEMFDAVFFEQIGCKDEIEVECSQPNRHGHVIINDDYGSHRRGVDGFDPECTIDGLEYTLQNINLKRSQIVWSVVKNFHKSIYGTIEISSNQHYVNSSKKAQFSKMGNLLVKYSWLPDDDGIFHKPAEIILTSLPNGFDKESLEARYIAQKLGFKANIEQELLAQLPESKKEFIELLSGLSPNEVDKVNEFIQKIKEQNAEGQSDVSAQDMLDKFKDSLESNQSVGDGVGTDDAWKGMNPDEEEGIRRKYGDGLLDKLKNTELKQDIKVTKKIEITGEIDPKEFLLEQYKGYCQICNTLLDLGAGKKPYFDVYRIVETRNMHAWSNMEFNVICSCPNCHALMKHGGVDLKTIFEVAEKVLKNEIAPEEIDERKGDFYVINIGVAGEKRQIFYTPAHMAKFAAFIGKSEE